MRYFRYKNTKENMNNALKEHYLSLPKDEKSTVRKEKLWRRIANCVTGFVFIFCMAVGIYLLKLIPIPNAIGWKILCYIGIVLLGFVLLIVSSALTYVISLPFWKKVESFNLPAIKKEILAKACAHLREYYQLQEPYIVTKCYDSTDKQFTNHDVCIFVVGNELRITTDIVKGFLHGDRDLGCYALNKEEICLSKKCGDKFLIAELTAKDTTFLLGYRAKSFIEKHFISK